jgi:nitric oxide reductase activation protein
VWPATAPAGSGDWVDHILARHAALVRRVRRRFDGLRPRRVRLSHQTDGADVDLSAYVAAFGDWRAGEPGDDRLYVAERPGRRDLAIMLLIDVSASTDSWVGGRLRIIDVEKEALIVLLEALDALGDRHAILSFSGQGPREVRVLTVKAFQEPVSEAVRRRIAALDSDRYTRAGAAIRHATAVLAGQAVRHRLLLVLSDGKPNDIDEYEGRYGIEDTRQAVAEARLQGLVPFCLTVDREARRPTCVRSSGGAAMRSSGARSTCRRCWSRSCGPCWRAPRVEHPVAVVLSAASPPACAPATTCSPRRARSRRAAPARPRRWPAGAEPTTRGMWRSRQRRAAPWPPS